MHERGGTTLAAQLPTSAMGCHTQSLEYSGGFAGLRTCSVMGTASCCCAPLGACLLLLLMLLLLALLLLLPVRLLRRPLLIVPVLTLLLVLLLTTPLKPSLLLLPLLLPLLLASLSLQTAAGPRRPGATAALTAAAVGCALASSTLLPPPPASEAAAADASAAEGTSKIARLKISYPRMPTTSSGAPLTTPVAGYGCREIQAVLDSMWRGQCWQPAFSTQRMKSQHTCTADTHIRPWLCLHPPTSGISSGTWCTRCRALASIPLPRTPPQALTTTPQHSPASGISMRTGSRIMRGPKVSVRARRNSVCTCGRPAAGQQVEAHCALSACRAVS